MAVHPYCSSIFTKTVAMNMFGCLEQEGEDEMPAAIRRCPGCSQSQITGVQGSSNQDVAPAQQPCTDDWLNSERKQSTGHTNAAKIWLLANQWNFIYNFKYKPPDWKHPALLQNVCPAQIGECGYIVIDYSAVFFNQLFNTSHYLIGNESRHHL